MDIDVHIIPATTTNTAEGKRKRIQGMESEILKKRTTIELILLSATVNSHARGRGRRGQQMSEFHLTARIVSVNDVLIIRYTNDFRLL